MSRRFRAPAGRAKSAAAVLLVLALAGGALAGFSAASTSLPPLPSPGAVTWTADMETGTLSQWTAGQMGEAVFNTGTGAVAVTQEEAHGGSHALKLSISGASGQVQAARIFRWAGTEREAYYSVWLYIPRNYLPAQWWDIFQFKAKAADTDPASNPMWVVDVNNRSDGSMYLYLWDAIDQRSYTPKAKLNVPVGKWFKLTAYYQSATDRSGRIALWQDDTLLYDIDRVQTSIGPHIQWSLANYTDDITPPDVTIYADDAEISTVLEK